MGDNTVENNKRKSLRKEIRRAELKSFYLSGDSLINNEREKKMVAHTPTGTTKYTAESQDTLNSIALKFDVTPNKLVQINRLFSRVVVPGQILNVPDSRSSHGTANSPDCDSPLTPPSSDAEYDKLPDADFARKVTAKNFFSPVHSQSIMRVTSSGSEDDEPLTEKFLKMNCRYITDGEGVVGGVMIVTPNNIMFDPHKSDSLVIENGCEEYGLICPMEEVISIALYPDISHMKIKDALPSDVPKDLSPLYRPGDWDDLSAEKDLNPFNRFKGMNKTSELKTHDSLENCYPVQKSMEDASDEVFTELAPSPVEEEHAAVGRDVAKNMLSKISSVESDLQDKGYYGKDSTTQGKSTHLSETLESKKPDLLVKISDCCEQQTVFQKTLTGQLSKMCIHSFESPTKMVGVPLDEVSSVNNEVICNSGDLSTDKNKGINLENDLTKGSRTPLVQVYSSGVHRNNNEMTKSALTEVIEEDNFEAGCQSELQAFFNKLKGPIEDMLPSKEEKSKKPPMFLCIKVGKPMRKSFVSYNLTTMHQYVKKGKQPEYWFAVPQERVDHLYAFFVQWSPEVYGKEAKDQGFVVVEKDELEMIDNFFSDPVPKSWEIITIEEAKRRQSVGSFYEEEADDLQPVLTDPSELLESFHIEKLSQHLPARTQGYAWRLTYSTAVHGTSLRTLYRSLAVIDTPVLLVVKDMDNQIFGALASHPFRLSDHCFGTGETFLYTFNPQLKIFRWSGENSYFIKGDKDSLELGGGSGHFGLWLDADLYHGRSNPCSTFNNETLSKKEDFIVQDLEVWTFV
ncbi:nuclear receptor coactivator 7-like isoform X6 [Chiloscyllium plagiosum]|nr:nuclear receptor coactivator 7-like isoform X6 [Chiloscyllium plagiosum]XP_043539880.1 nuclear receptor coactivator 7-like isoform X6 [Chiloscyllium plagiosum]XP_043539882.1 nuclear receptor coactivator 7-like isoform X6 [Chiloscyllium plagiosum]XP_043539884.1 nuclear receptor coactivator 7-like isoform X6 [Chiloscyllium plagiosum]